ncbi:MAG: YcaO-related McrA-glycine thioamidation protein [Methanococci archaeon]|nr:YcaO-related McrA-glycine thioamidation protein [Methanococci archaeon]
MDIKYKLASYRICSPEETFEKIQGALKKIETIEIKNIQHLDKINIPVYYLTRKVIVDGKEGVAIHYGKGANEIQSKVSACMEAIERFSASYDKNKVKEKPDNPINVNDLILPQYADKNVKDWVEGIDIINDEIVDVPADAVFYPNSGKLFRGNTNGLASGNSLDEAILHATLEVIERDAWSLADLSRKIPRKINPEDAKNPLIHELLEKYEKAGVKITLKDLTSEFDIPVVAAISDDLSRDPLMLCVGVGCHLHPEIAILRALTEVAQSRASQLHGFRRDAKLREEFTSKIPYERLKRIHRKWFEFEEEINIADMPNNASYDLKNDLKFIKDKISEFGFDKLIYVDLNKVGVDAVRVIIPKMEIYTIDRDRLSRRAVERVKNLYY